MPNTQEHDYQVRFSLPDAIERGADNTLSCPVYDDGALVTITSGTISIYDPANVAIVDGATAAGSYTYTAPSSLTLAEGYRVIWTLVIAGETYSFRNDAEVVRRRLYCPITDSDLYRVAPALDPNGTDPISRKTTFDPEITEAFTQVQHRLRESGNRPNLIISSSALRDVTLHTTLSLIFEALAHRDAEAYQDRADAHRERAEAAFNRLHLVYADEDQANPDPDLKRARPSVVYFGRGR